MFFLPLIISINATAQENPDSLSIQLEEIEIRATRAIPLSKGGNIQYDPDDFYGSIRLMGEADIVNHLKHLPGSFSRGDFGTGVMIDGANPTQMVYRIDKVPIFFPYRFGGVFSTFNTPFYSRIDFERGFHKGEMPSRVGSKVDLHTIKHSPAFSGTANIGLLSSSFSISVPIGERFLINMGARISYVDELYGPLLKKDMDIRYRFHDINLNAIYNIDGKNSLSLNLFQSYDKLRYADDKYLTRDHMAWENRLISLSWGRKGNINIENRVYYSAFSNKFDLLMSNLTLEMPSSLSMVGASGEISRIEISNHSLLSAGYELNLYRNSPQDMYIDGYGNEKEANRMPTAHPLEARIYGDVRIPMTHFLNLYAGLSVGYYSNTSKYHSFSIDPRVTLNIPVRPGSINLHVGTYSQYLHQVGFSEAGLASDFMVAAGTDLPRQNSISFEADYSCIFPYGLYFSINAYYRVINHEPEYEGSFLNVIDKDYNIYSHIYSCNGFNTGINLQLRKAIGKFRGDLGIGYGVARRKDPNYMKYIRGRSEPGFSLNTGLTYEPNLHWEFNANFRYNTGRPYTPVTAIYMISGNVMTEYGVPNSSTFPSWQQLDLGVTWKLFSGKNNRLPLTHLINFSVINAYGHHNVEMMTYTYNPESNIFHLKKIYSLYRFLPSISYTIKF